MMTQDEIIRMAREAGLGTVSEIYGYCVHSTAGARELERFAALVAAHEREAFKVYVNQVIADREMAVHDAVLAEREACAKVAEEYLTQGRSPLGKSVAAAIRARGNNG